MCVCTCVILLEYYSFFQYWRRTSFLDIFGCLLDVVPERVFKKIIINLFNVPSPCIVLPVLMYA